jgi:ArsR family transcriptional regulator
MLTYGLMPVYATGVNTSTKIESMTFEERAELLKAVADPNRLEILEILSPEIRCNCHLQDKLDLAPNLLSYHLKVLREAGLIEGTKRGRWVDYELTPDARARLVAVLPGA